MQCLKLSTGKNDNISVLLFLKVNSWEICFSLFKTFFSPKGSVFPCFNVMVILIYFSSLSMVVIEGKMINKSNRLLSWNNVQSITEKYHLRMITNNNYKWIIRPEDSSQSRMKYFETKQYYIKLATLRKYNVI